MKRILTTPVAAADLRNLRIGDIVYLTGTLVTGRDDVHHRVVREGLPCPVDLSGRGVFHAGPIVRELPDRYELISVGPTSSIRMEADAAAFIEKTGVKIMIGKGGMGDKTAAACRAHGAIHCVFPGGCAVLAATRAEAVEAVFWRELGMPECMWVLRVKEFGPLIVSIDTLGNNLFADNRAYAQSRAGACMAPAIELVEEDMRVAAQT